MLAYSVITATLDEIKINEDDLRRGKPPYKFFLLVDGEDGKKYQVKLNEHKQRHNINEFIAHYTGSCSKMPLLDGVFLELDDIELKKLRDRLDKLKGKLKSADIDMMKQGLFFGIEWKQNVVKIVNEAELMPRINETSNYKSFYSLFPFDQYLKNYDRHPGNHLVYKVGNSKQYRLIDFDRLFFSTNWSKVPSIKHDFSPILMMPYHGFLNHQVNNSNIEDLHFYANYIQSIDDREIQDMCDIIRQIYNVPDLEVNQIEDWMLSRKADISMKCLENEKHFPNVTKKGLYSVS